MVSIQGARVAEQPTVDAAASDSDAEPHPAPAEPAAPRPRAVTGGTGTPGWRLPREQRMQKLSLARMARNRIGLLLFNTLITHVPSHWVRLSFLRAFGATIGEKTSILRGTQVLDIEGITIGDHCSIGWRCLLDARAGITIGNNVVIASDVHILGGGHDVNDPEFSPIPRPVTIDDYCWIASRSTLLGGTRMGRGAVVSAMSLAHGYIRPLSIVLGVPAKRIGQRDPDALQYEVYYKPLFF